MKLFFITLMVVVLSSCAMQAIKEDAEATQLIHSRAGGIIGLITGKVDSCTFITTDEEVEVKTIEFVEGRTTCKVTLEKE